MSNENKRFDGWEDCSDVDCNKCENYYTNSCDGVPEGKIRPCTAFKASRSVVIPEKIKVLEKGLKSLDRAFLWLNVAVLVSAVSMLIHLFTH